LIVKNYNAVIPLKCPPGKRETEAFHWIRKESEIAQFVTRLDFSYQRGFRVEFVVPKEWTPDQQEQIIDRVMLAYGQAFWR